ncbi:hypothetical protein niasHS_012678 [Heterodera schachtii]|uniref:Peptidase M41 domain-containing protein n=1 Tax=Heterodera schachtii TaxID=97005 RepID=A0ABD2IM70_HETSC
MQGEIVSEIHRVAFHEAGHAVACRRNKDCNQIRFITAAAGVDVKNDGKRYPYHGKTVVAGRESYTRQQILATVEYFVGSTAAELLFFSAPFVPGMECDMHFARRAAEFIVCAIEEDGLKTVQLDLGKGACSKERLADPEIQRRIQQYIGEAIQRVNADFQNDDVKNIIKELAFKVFYSATLTLQTQEVYRFFAEHTEAEFAQAGAVAPADISLPAGPMPAELHLHGDMEPQLRKLGMPTRLENGVIELSKEFTHPTVRRPGPHFEAVRPLVGPIPRQSARPVEYATPLVCHLLIIWCLSFFFFSSLIFGFASSSVEFVSHQSGGIRNNCYFPSNVRQVLSDFSVMIAIVCMTFLDVFLCTNTTKPSWHGRGWLVHPFIGNSLWTPPLALILVVLACVLIFMGQQIIAVIVNRRENQLKRGCGYHLDLFDLLGVESESREPGEHSHFISYLKRYITGIVTVTLIGLSVTMTKLLKFIRMPVLSGVFLYMGISVLGGTQLFDRILITLMPMKYQPDTIYICHVPISGIHKFALFQVACPAILWSVKSIKFALFQVACPAILWSVKSIKFALFQVACLAILLIVKSIKSTLKNRWIFIAIILCGLIVESSAVEVRDFKIRGFDMRTVLCTIETTANYPFFGACASDPTEEPTETTSPTTATTEETTATEKTTTEKTTRTTQQNEQKKSNNFSSTEIIIFVAAAIFIVVVIAACIRELYNVKREKEKERRKSKGPRSSPIDEKKLEGELPSTEMSKPLLSGEPNAMTLLDEITETEETERGETDEQQQNNSSQCIRTNTNNEQARRSSTTNSHSGINLRGLGTDSDSPTKKKRQMTGNQHELPKVGSLPNDMQKENSPQSSDLSARNMPSNSAKEPFVLKGTSAYL